MDFEAFVRHVATAVPGLPENATSAFDTTRFGLLDHAQRAALRHALHSLNPEVSAEMLDGAQSLGDLHALLQDEDLDMAPLVRGSYRTSRTRLRPVLPEDVPLLYAAALDPQNAFRWRFRGGTPSLDAFAANLFSGVEAQFAVVSAADDSLQGVVSAYNADLQGGHARIAFFRVGSSGFGGEMIEGMATFISYLFDHFPFRKLFAEIPEYNLYLVEGVLGGLLQKEAELSEYYFFNDAHWSLVFGSIARRDWDDFMSGITTSDSRISRST